MTSLEEKPMHAIALSKMTTATPPSSMAMKEREEKKGSLARIYTFSVCNKRGAMQWKFVIATTQT